MPMKTTGASRRPKPTKFSMRCQSMEGRVSGFSVAIGGTFGADLVDAVTWQPARIFRIPRRTVPYSGHPSVLCA